MWFRNKKGKMVCVMRENFHTDSQYYEFILNL